MSYHGTRYSTEVLFLGDLGESWGVTVSSQGIEDARKIGLVHVFNTQIQYAVSGYLDTVWADIRHTYDAVLTIRVFYPDVVIPQRIIRHSGREGAINVCMQCVDIGTERTGTVRT